METTLANADDIALANAALARIRLRRSLRRQQSWADAAQVLPFILPPLVIFGIAALGHAFGLNFIQWADDSALAISLAFLGLMTLILAVIGGMTVFMSVVMVSIFFGIFFLPFVLWDTYWYLLDWYRGTDAEDLLERDGRVDPSWTRGHKRRKQTLERMADEDSELILDKDGLRPRRAGPTAKCPDCSAPLRSISPGLRRCEHCAFERFDEPPACPASLEKAQANIAKVAKGATDFADRKALWRRFRDSDSKYKSNRRVLKWLAIIYFGAAALADLGNAADLKWLSIVPLFVMVLGALPLIGYFFATLARWQHLRFQAFRPGVLGYDLALSGELVRVLAHQGRMKKADVATHLGTSVTGLDGVLASLSHHGKVPIYVDSKNDELISLHARRSDDDRCPACAGRLSVAENATIACQFCGAAQLG